MNNDLGDQPKPTQAEGQPKERIIEVNEWFTPFEDYDQIPYDKNPDGATLDADRSKKLYFQLANVGRFNVTLWWSTDLVNPREAEGEKYLIVLPTSEKFIDGSELKSEQEKMEMRPMKIEVEFDNDKGDLKESLPYNIEVELPSRSIVSAGMDINNSTDGPGAFDNWDINGDKIHSPVIPETGNLINKLNFRFVPK